MEKLTKKQWGLIIIVIVLLLTFTFRRFGVCDFCDQTEILKRYVSGNDVMWVCSDCASTLKFFYP